MMNARFTFSPDAGYLTIIVNHDSEDGALDIVDFAVTFLKNSDFKEYKIFDVEIIGPTQTHYFAAISR